MFYFICSNKHWNDTLFRSTLYANRNESGTIEKKERKAKRELRNSRRSNNLLSPLAVTLFNRWFDCHNATPKVNTLLRERTHAEFRPSIILVRLLPFRCHFLLTFIDDDGQTSAFTRVDFILFSCCFFRHCIFQPCFSVNESEICQLTVISRSIAVPQTDKIIINLIFIFCFISSRFIHSRARQTTKWNMHAHCTFDCTTILAYGNSHSRIHAAQREFQKYAHNSIDEDEMLAEKKICRFTFSSQQNFHRSLCFDAMKKTKMWRRQGEVKTRQQCNIVNREKSPLRLHSLRARAFAHSKCQKRYRVFYYRIYERHRIASRCIEIDFDF